MLKKLLIPLFLTLLPHLSSAQLPVTDNTAEPYLGVYGRSIGGTIPNNYEGITNCNHFSSWLNRSQVWLMSFSGGYAQWSEIETLPATVSAGKRWLLSHPNSIHVLSVGMLPGYATGGNGMPADDTDGQPVTLARGANGNYDSHFVTLAQKLANAGITDRVIIRLGWEFNGNWYPWRADADPVNFPIYFARIVKTMRDVTPVGTTAGGDPANLRFCWNGARFQNFSYSVANLYPIDIPASTVFPVHPAYPGNTYVDYVGLDLYDASTFYDNQTYPWDPALSLPWKAWSQSHNATGNKNGIPVWQAIADARGKPMSFPEWALSNTQEAGRADGGRDNPSFIQYMFNYIHDPANNVAFHVYYDDPSGGTSNGRISNQPGQGPSIHPNASKRFQQLWGLPMPNLEMIGTTPAGVKADGITVVGGGGGYLTTGTTDNFYFTSRTTPQAASGPTLDMFQVKIESTQVLDGQSGIMVRQNTNTNAIYAALFLRNNQCVFQARTTAGAVPTEISATALAAPNLAAPIWLKLVRNGSSITGYRSSDGLNWTYVSGQTVAFTGSTKIGVAVSSASSTLTNAVQHDNLDDADRPTILAGSPAPLPANAIVKDNSDASGITLSPSTGTWAVGTTRTDRQGINYHQAAVANAGTITYTPTIPAAGLYEVFARWPADGTFSYNVPIAVNFSGGSRNLVANQESGRNQWNYVGTYPFATSGGNVVLSAVTTGGGTHCMADAFLFVPLPQPSSINFNNYAVSSYSGSQDVSGTYAVQDAGATLMLTGNTWKKIPFAYAITPNTVLEFDFRSTVEGEVHGIGLDTDNTYESASIFTLHGTDGSLGRQNYNNYSGTGWVHYTIPIGTFYTGSRSYLFFVSDKDASPFTNTSYFRNVQIHE